MDSSPGKVSFDFRVADRDPESDLSKKFDVKCVIYPLVFVN